ncbi:MAG TPA: hypothetical protein VMR25_10090 [Planctomycetaceae bacterium]|jgi:hypothetical protein|nr:hypothetical protein [Planctomycetaceae bacterium]
MMTPEQLATRLGEALPEQLKCVVLYGSAAAGDFVPGASNYNVLILLEPLTVAQLDALAPTILAWSRAGHSPPLVFTPEGLTASTDAFPIELLDIQQSRRVLWGPDLLASMRVHPAHLRLQIERELTGKLLSLRGKYLLTEGKREAATELMLRSLSTILVLFRAALRLYQGDVPAKKLDALLALRKHIDFDVEPFKRLLDMKQSPTEARGTSLVSFDSYLRAIEAVASAVNLHSQPQRNDA